MCLVSKMEIPLLTKKIVIEIQRLEFICCFPLRNSGTFCALVGPFRSKVQHKGATRDGPGCVCCVEVVCIDRFPSRELCEFVKSCGDLEQLMHKVCDVKFETIAGPVFPAD